MRPALIVLSYQLNGLHEGDTSTEHLAIFDNHRAKVLYHFGRIPRERLSRVPLRGGRPYTTPDRYRHRLDGAVRVHGHLDSRGASVGAVAVRVDELHRVSDQRGLAEERRLRGRLTLNGKLEAQRPLLDPILLLRGLLSERRRGCEHRRLEQRRYRKDQDKAYHDSPPFVIRIC